MKRICTAALALALSVCCALPAFALDSEGKGDWGVTFTPDTKMNVTYEPNAISDAVRDMQPGDSVTMTVTLKNEHPDSTDWYMSNEVLKTLENTAGATQAANGAYTYILTYTDPDGNEEELYNSNRVGGTTSSRVLADVGLKAATNSLDEFFYLDTYTTGQQAKVSLYVALDGESQGNVYQDTLAQLQMNFGVELTQTPRREIRYHTVRTGDEEKVLLWSGAAALALAIYQYRRDRRERKNG